MGVENPDNCSLAFVLSFLSSLFSDMLVGVIIGTILWELFLAIHETIMRAAVADLTDIQSPWFGLRHFQHPLRSLVAVGWLP